MTATIAISFDDAELPNMDDSYLAALWHTAQANPADIEDPTAQQIAESIGREIILRWLAKTPPLLWKHQGAHARFDKLRAVGHQPGEAVA